MAETNKNINEGLNIAELQGGLGDIRSAVNFATAEAVEGSDILDNEWEKDLGGEGALGGNFLVQTPRRKVATEVDRVLNAPPVNRERWINDTILGDKLSGPTQVNSGWIAENIRQDKEREANKVIPLPSAVRNVREQVAQATQVQLIDYAYNPEHGSMIQEAARDEMRFRRERAA